MSTPSAPAQGPLYGLVAEFATPEELLEATRRARSTGYRRLEAYTPFPVHGLAEALDFHQTHIPVTFELTILIAALAAVFGMLALNGLPMPYHPLFNVPRFALVTRDRFFLCIEARDPKFDRMETRRFLEGVSAYNITEVEP